MHTPISTFRAHPDSPFSPQLVSGSSEYIAYVVGKKKVRLLAQDQGQRGAIEHQSSNAEGGIVAVGLKGDTLASLTDAGELRIGTVYAEGKDTLGFDPLVALTFPDLNPARGLAWASAPAADMKVLAAWGQSPAAFLIWLSPRPLAVEIPHSLPGSVESIVFFNKGRHLAVSDLNCVECFELDHVKKTFTKVAVFDFGPQISCRRVALFEDESGDADFVIGAFSGTQSITFLACPVRLGQELAWIRSSLQIPESHVARVALIFDPLLQVFILDNRDGSFTVLGLRSDAPAFAILSGKWREALPVHSMALCSGLRDVAAGVHVPLYVFQSEWVSFYGLRLPAVNDKSESKPSKAPVVQLETSSPQLDTLLAKPTPPKTKQKAVSVAPATTAPSAAINGELKEVVRSVFMEKALPAIEAACAEMLSQVKAHIAGLGRDQDEALKALDAKIGLLTHLVQELSGRVEALPSAEQLGAVFTAPNSSAGSSPSEALTESAEDLQRRELDEMLDAGVAPADILIKALGLGSLEILAWLLARLSPESTIDSLPPPACLSLAQQLGADLSIHTELKLDWLAELFTTFSPPANADQTFLATMAEVLEELFTNLRGLAIQIPESEAVLSKKTKTAMRLIRMLL